MAGSKVVETGGVVAKMSQEHAILKVAIDFCSIKSECMKLNKNIIDGSGINHEHGCDRKGVHLLRLKRQQRREEQLPPAPDRLCPSGFS